MASNDASLFAYEEHDSRKEKSPTALRTISEASEVLDVPQHVLRFWETKFPQIKPLKRNGGRRFYRPQDLEVLQQIKHLLYSQGYTIKGAKKAVDEFVHARASYAVTTNEWAAAVPPANVNDNAAPEVEAEDILSELAQALGEADEEANATPPEAPMSLAQLQLLREGLAQARDMLRQKLVTAEAA